MAKVLTVKLLGCVLLRAKMLTILLWSLMGTVSAAAFETEDFEHLSLEELLAIDIVAASGRAIRSEEAPGIVTILTREELRNSGARDLIDALRLVPGFEFGMDVQSVVGMGFRGNWGHEGKILLLVDGLEQNEILFSTTQLGNHYPIDIIERIEVIRGPGSVVYGGNAELAVVNVVTMGAAGLQGVKGTTSGSWMQETYGRGGLSLTGGQKVNDLAVDFSFHAGAGRRSEFDYLDAWGDGYSMRDGARIDPLMAILGIDYQGLRGRFMYDNYRLTMQDGFSESLEKAWPLSFRGYLGDIRYDLDVGERLTLTPFVSYRAQMPYWLPEEGDDDIDLVEEELYYANMGERMKLGIRSNYLFTDDIVATVGLVGIRDRGLTLVQDVDAGDVGFYDYDADEPTYEVAYLSLAAFAEGLFNLSLANFVVGGRFEHHEQFGSSFVPRAAVTRRFDQLHFKLLASQAFRAPGIENINLNGDIVPERTTVFEAEVGYVITEGMTLTLNAFDTTINDIIVYVWDAEEETESYENREGRSGTSGLELGYRVRGRRGYAYLTYSFYTAAFKPKIDDYSVPDPNDEDSILENVLLAFPAHKVTLNSSYQVLDGLFVSPSLVFLSERFGYATASEEDEEEGVIERFAPLLLANLFVNYRNLGTPGLDVGVGVYDILDQRCQFIQPYDSLHAPLPGAGREFLLRVGYQREF